MEKPPEKMSYEKARRPRRYMEKVLLFSVETQRDNSIHYTKNMLSGQGFYLFFVYNIGIFLNQPTKGKNAVEKRKDRMILFCLFRAVDIFLGRKKQ